MMKKFLLGLAVIWVCNGLLAQEASESTDPGALSTDRPVQSETPFTVPKKHLQFEMGFNYEQGMEHSYNLNTGPNLLIKYGLTDRLELRMINNYLNLESRYKSIINQSDSNQTVSGIDAPLFGAKYKLIGANGGGTNAVISLSSKVNAWGSEEFEVPASNLLARVTLGQSFTESWYGIAGFEYGYYDGIDDQMFYVLQTGYSFSFGLTAIIEYYAYSMTSETKQAINGALVYLINDRHQVDLSGGAGLGDNFYSHYFSVGYSFRLGL